jgi:hypothetical protein
MLDIKDLPPWYCRLHGIGCDPELVTDGQPRTDGTNIYRARRMLSGHIELGYLSHVEDTDTGVRWGEPLVGEAFNPPLSDPSGRLATLEAILAKDPSEANLKALSDEQNIAAMRTSKERKKKQLHNELGADEFDALNSYEKSCLRSTAKLRERDIRDGKTMPELEHEFAWHPVSAHTAKVPYTKVAPWRWSEEDQ